MKELFNKSSTFQLDIKPSKFGIKKVLDKYYNFIVIFLIVLILIAFFDKALSLGLIVLAFLMLITFFVLSKLGLKNRTLTWLLVITLIVHLGTVLFIYYFNFQPFSGGSGGYKTAHLIATEIAENFKQGNFSFEGVPYYEIGDHPYRYYSLIIGVLYTITMPEIIIGQIFQVWLAILAIIFFYLIIRELGLSKKWAFLMGLAVTFYPSYLFYSSLLLKDGLVVVLALAGLFFSLKIIKKFSWKYFLIFYISLGLLINFRMYVGYALLFSFILSWILLAELSSLRKKVAYAIIIIFLLGLLPEISINQGFYGIDTFKNFFKPETISFYQQEAYFPASESNGSSVSGPGSSEDSDNFIIAGKESKINSEEIIGYGSSWSKEEVNFKERPFRYLLNEFKYFIYVLFGPSPWQMKKPVHFFALIETIPWYVLFLFIIRGIYQSIKGRNKLVFPLILFSLMVLLPIAIYVSNFGIITRIRVPAFIALLPLIPLGFTRLNTASQ